MTFEKWLLEQRHRNDPIGDLANDFYHAVRINAEYGKRCNKNHLGKRNACKLAYKALDRATKEYQFYLSKQ